MNLAKELLELAKSKLETNSKDYIEEVRRKAKRAANGSRVQVEVELPTKSRSLKREIANALYEDGFSVTTKDFPSTGSFYVIVDWSREVPKKPEHIDYTGY